MHLPQNRRACQQHEANRGVFLPGLICNGGLGLKYRLRGHSSTPPDRRNLTVLSTTRATVLLVVYVVAIASPESDIAVNRGLEATQDGADLQATEVLRPECFRPAIPPRDRRKTPLAGWNFSREGGYSAAVWLDIAVSIQGGICKLSVGCENVPTG